MTRGYNQGMEPNPYEAPKVPSDRPQEPSPPVWRFTIVEALVVIAAIMILWSLLFPAVRAVHS